MKKITLLFMALLSMTVSLTSCSDDDGGSKTQQSNGVQMTVSGEASIYEDDANGVTVNVLLAFAPEKDQTITLSLDNNSDDVARLDNTTLSIKAGTKTAQFKVLSNDKGILVNNRVVTVSATFSDSNMHLSGSAPSITIMPRADLPELTEAQKALIEGYKTKFGIDVAKVLGKVSVSTSITFNDDDKESYNEGNDTRSYEGTTVITLSDQATEDQPVLKMTTNPMGLTSFLYEMMRKQTVEDYEYFNNADVPYSYAAVQASGYNYSSDTFDVTLDGIKIDPTSGTVDFTGTKLDAYGDEITGVPFSYVFSAWERLKAKAEAGESVEITEGDETVSYALSDIIEMGGSLNPENYLGTTTIDTNYWESILYVTPTGKIDFTAGTMTFAFPWDFTNAYGYEQVNVSYKF